ncbi:putative DD41D transposase [Trichonephila clavipes]|nr:putative DD41D transposase [Trichonephila clavipes]
MKELNARKGALSPTLRTYTLNSCRTASPLGLSFVALIILGSRLHQVDKEAGFLQVILNTWFRESVPHPMAVAASLANDSQTRGSGAAAAQRGRSPPMLSERAQRTLLAFREDVRYFYRELDAARMTLILSIVFVGIFILSWWWMAFAIKQARSDGGVSLRTVLLLAVFAAVDVAASTGFILLRIIMRNRTLNCNKTTMYYSIDMNFFNSKDNLVALHFKYDQARRRFVEWAQNEIAVAPDFHRRILFSDEAHFWLNGYVNKQNCHIWSEANPQVYVETPLHPEKLTVWCALWAGGIIGPYFFKNDEGHNVTVNGDRYRAMITNFFIPELNNHDVQELWFQQDGATCHTARVTIDLLKDVW